MPKTKPTTVSLVLGSGGARGLTHIGIIEWLEEQGYHIESVAGASMGALVGGVYAAGELDAYRSWVCALSRGDVLRFLDFAFSAGGLFKGDRIMETLRGMVGEHLIEELPVSYTAVAVDIDRQREVWFSRGPLFDAIRASIAVPSVFTPHQVRGMTLLDGGLLNPVPIAPTFRDLTDLTVAVNLNAEPPRTGPASDATTEAAVEGESDGSYQDRIRQFLDSLGGSLRSPARSELGVFDLVSRSFETMQNAIAAVKLAAYAPDVVIQVPRDACAAHEFHRAREMIELGYRLAAEAMGPKSGTARVQRGR
ncbi:MAG: patatin-like phospholipase family protein [Chromatiaceae bacterium]|jgi:NTE family protein|nr:patatin-like phospholipase family protein [Chromatiaceae bacterium]